MRIHSFVKFIIQLLDCKLFQFHRCLWYLISIIHIYDNYIIKTNIYLIINIYKVFRFRPNILLMSENNLSYKNRLEYNIRPSSHILKFSIYLNIFILRERERGVEVLVAFKVYINNNTRDIIRRVKGRNVMNTRIVGR